MYMASISLHSEHSTFIDTTNHHHVLPSYVDTLWSVYTCIPVLAIAPNNTAPT